jgi:hypothetical protein
MEKSFDETMNKAIQKAIADKVNLFMNERGEMNGEKMQLIGNVLHEKTEHFNLIYFECRYPSSFMKVYYQLVYSTLFIDLHYRNTNVIDLESKGYSLNDLKARFKNYLQFTLKHANDELVNIETV